MIENATLETFSEHLNSKFRMHAGQAEPLEVELISAEDVGSSNRQIQFSLVFRAPVSAPPLQAIYKLEHDRLGTLELFLVPISRDEKGLCYEAIFNRQIK